MNKNKTYTYKEAFSILKYYERKYKHMGSSIVYDSTTIILFTRCRTSDFGITYYAKSQKFEVRSMAGIEFEIDDVHKIGMIYNIMLVYKNNYIVTKYLSRFLYLNIPVYASYLGNFTDLNRYRVFFEDVGKIKVDLNQNIIKYIDKNNNNDELKFKIYKIYSPEPRYTIESLNKNTQKKLRTTLDILMGV